MPNKDKAIYNNYMKAYMLNRYHQRRTEGIIRLGGKCVNCETTEKLEFDHIDPKEKSFSVAKLWSVNKNLFWSEINKCQLLCQPCHILKTHRDNGTIPGSHGRTRYRQGCRCETCKLDQSKAQKEWKMRKLNN